MGGTERTHGVAYTARRATSAGVFITDREPVVLMRTDANHCYQNAIAARVNGILKDEYDLDQTFPTSAGRGGA